jgi:hypothetical protein
MKITQPRLVIGTVGASVAAVLLPSAAAVAFISPPLVLLAEAQGPAHLIAGGAGIDVPVEYSCTADEMYLSVQVTEKVGNGIASGSGSATVTCNGATHRALVRVTATVSGRAFAVGSAATQTDVSGCRERGDRYMCGSDRVVRTIRLTR